MYESKYKHYIELNEEFSNLWIPRFKSLYNMVHETQYCDHAWWKYVVKPNHIENRYLKHFPWLTQVPSFDMNEHMIIFFKSNGEKYNHNIAHIDPNDIHWSITLPIIGCTDETVTNWVEPVQSQEIFRSTTDAGDKTVDMLKGDVRIIDNYCFNDKAIVFNSSVWHEAITSHRRDEDRVLAKLWTPNLSQNYFMDLLDEFIL